MAIIDIPYVSQLENGARKFHNDCGAASGVMLVRAYKGNQSLTVDQYYDQTGQRKDQYLSASQVMSVLSRHGIPSKWRRGVSESDVRLLLDSKRPMIVLYNYKIIRQRGISTEIPFTGFHFAVLVGIDEFFVYLNDPLWSGEKGKNLQIPLEIWMEAWEKFPLFKGVPANPPRGAIVPDYSVDAEEVEPIADDGSTTRMRVIFPLGMNVRLGPGTNFTIVDTRNTGDVVRVLETKEVGDDLWACLGTDRWIAIRFNGNTYMVPEFPGGTDNPEEHEVFEVNNHNGLDVRAGAGFTYPIVDVALKGESLKIYKKIQVKDIMWGRIGIDQWVPLTIRGQNLMRHIM